MEWGEGRKESRESAVDHQEEEGGEGEGEEEDEEEDEEELVVWRSVAV